MSHLHRLDQTLKVLGRLFHPSFSGYVYFELFSIYFLSFAAIYSVISITHNKRLTVKDFVFFVLNIQKNQRLDGEIFKYCFMKIVCDVL